MSRQKQQGLSLISLLVGLFISMLCILAGLTLYRSTLRLSTDAKLDAQIDGQVTSALLTLQHELQNAGFNMADTTVAHITRADYTYAFKGSNVNAPVLAWRYEDGGNVICRAVKEIATSEDDINYRQLELVTAAGCTASVDLTGLNWETGSQTNVIGRWPIFGELEDYITDNTNLFKLGPPLPATCSPFGALTPEPHQQVTISAPSSASINGADGAQLHSTTICLLNTAG